jgi:hypothetical protein
LLFPSRLSNIGDPPTTRAISFDVLSASHRLDLVTSQFFNVLLDWTCYILGSAFSYRASPADEVDQDHDDGDHQKNVDKPA